MHGLFLEEAIEAAHSKSLNIGNIHYDKTPANSEDAKNYQVYKQSPITGTPTSIGRKVELWMTTDNNLLEEPDQVYMPEDSLGVEEN
jgi:beta-lactam-binding protein with PASTA domain